jgi:HPt (histidine-containing phosphotransfer) domain-containing protein
MDVNRDPAALRSLERAGGPELVKQMIRLFLENLPRRVAGALAGARGGNWTEVQRAGHSLKSSAGYLGLRDLAERAAAVEDLAAQGRGSDLRPLLNDLSEALPALQAHLTNLLHAL